MVKDGEKSWTDVLRALLISYVLDVALDAELVNGGRSPCLAHLYAKLLITPSPSSIAVSIHPWTRHRAQPSSLEGFQHNYSA